MRWSQTLIPTAREAPAEAESPGQKLLIRGGFIRRLGAGLYNYLPLGLRVIRKIEGIIRDEMAASGAAELLMPVLQPRELWEKSGRWNSKELPKLTTSVNRDKQEFILAPTHEEVITALAAAEIKSYKDLPKNLFQIQAKFRDELRPRFGLIRAREFIMKDGYSFDRDAEASVETYKKMEDAYGRIFSRCGLDVRKVLADPGAMGGGMTHEFMAPAGIGEDTIIKCGACPYASNIESAETGELRPPGGGTPAEVETVDTPGMKTVEQLSNFLKTPRAKFIKTLIYEADGVPCAALVRGDREINELKLKRLLGASELSLAGEKTIMEATGAPLGFSGPRGLKGIRIIADRSIPGVINAVAGANLPDKHFSNINAGRDFRADETADISLAEEGDPCPRCERPLEILKGIEVGQVFNLGTKYSEALGASFLDAGGTEKPCVMGCYGIGVSRTMAAAAEQNRDEKGIVWPPGIAPFTVLILPVNLKDEKINRASEAVYAKLAAKGVDALIDDRDLRAGVKFNDADLTGIPWRITAGKKASEGIVEIQDRKTGETEEAGIEEAAERFTGQLPAGARGL